MKLPDEELYKLVYRMRKNNFWDIIQHGELFAVMFSDGVIGYVEVSDFNPGSCVFSLYIGDEGVQSLLRMLNDSASAFSTFAVNDILLSQNCLQCSFENEAFLGEDTVQYIKQIAKKNKIKIKEYKTFPHFMKYAPYCEPAVLESEKDAERLREALEAAAELLEAVKMGNKDRIGLKLVSGRTKKIPIVEKTSNGYVISKINMPKRAAITYPVPRCDNEVALKKLCSFENKVSLECEIVRPLRAAAENEGEAAVFPAKLFAVNPESYFDLPVESVLHYEDDPDKLMNALFNSLLEFELSPSSVSVLNKMTYDFFKPLCSKLDIKLELIAEPSDFMESVQHEFDVQTEFGIVEEMSDEEFERLNNELGDLMNSMLGYNPGTITKEEMLDLLQSYGMNNLFGSEMEEENEKYLPNDKVIDLSLALFGDNNITVENIAYVISVSLYRGCYRHIKIPGSCTLDDLHYAINEAFDFDDDHIHVFHMDNKQSDSENAYYDERASKLNTPSSGVKLCELELYEGKHFKYLYDLKDAWVFQCKVLKVLENKKLSEPKVIKRVGASPEQYPILGESFDEEDD